MNLRNNLMKKLIGEKDKMAIEHPTNNTRKESDGILAVRLCKDVTKVRLDAVALGCQARSRNRLVNVLLRFGLDKLPKMIADVNILYKLLQEMTAENPELTKAVMERLLIEKEKLKDIDQTMEFLKKMQIYLSPPDQNTPQILEE